MSLSTALDTAKSSLVATQAQTALVSRNIANLNDPGATRKYANVVTGPGGTVQVASVAQSQNSVLFRNMLESTASVGSWSAIAAGYQRIDEMIGDTSLARSPAARIVDLSDALLSFATDPGSTEFARAAVDAAHDLATSLNELSATVETIRLDADKSLSLAATEMNKLLAQIEELNGKIVQGTSAGSDVTDFVDKRDQAVAQLSSFVGVTATIRGDNDLVLHTDSGVVLFDKKARLVEFTPTAALAPGVAGAAFFVDGVQVTGEGAFMPLKSGSVVGLTTLRDEVALTFQNQLDEIARALIATFAETGEDGMPQTGLFNAGTNGGALPASVHGLASLLQIDSRVIADPTLLRDGVNGDLDGAGAGFTARLLDLYDKMAGTQDFAPTAALGTSATLAVFAQSSLGWLQAGRADAVSQAEYQSTLLDRTKETLSNETGINMAQEMVLLTDLQRSYQASAKLIATIDEMLNALIQSV